MHHVIRWFGLFGSLACLIVLSLPTGVQAEIRAPQHSAKFIEHSKQTLPEYCYGSPALWTDAADGVQNANEDHSVLAWTGIDDAHTLNILHSSDGLNYTNKHVLGEQSITTPAVVEVPSQNNVLALAWVGMDPNHSLNVEWDAEGAQQKITMNDSSFHGLGFTYFNNALWLAWTGTDPNHSLNIRQFPVQNGRISVGSAVTLFQYSSLGIPSLATDPNGHQLVLSWTDTGLSHYLPNVLPYINILLSPDGANWKLAFSPPAPQISKWGPGITVISLTNNYYWAWTGTDPLQSLNLTSTADVHSWPAPITTLDEQVSGTPAVGAGSAKGVLVAWAGIDQYHSINVAEFLGN